MEILTSLFFVEAVFRCCSGRYCGSSCSGKPFGKLEGPPQFILNLEVWNHFPTHPPQRVTKRKKTLLQYSDCPSLLYPLSQSLRRYWFEVDEKNVEKKRIQNAL